MIKIWGRNTSSNVQKVMWAVSEIGLAHERIDVGGPFGMNREAAYLAMNPNGLVPTLEEDDGFLLWESNAIVRYLAVLLAVSLLLFPLGVAHRVYLFTALALGAAFFGWGCWGLRPTSGRRWARSLFGISILYLVLLFTMLMVDPVF